MLLFLETEILEIFEHRKGLRESKRKRDWKSKHSANVKGPR